MSKPAIIPEQTTAGIAVDPRTLERVIPESKRPDGSVRKQIKIRPGFTPQEDVRKFRGTKQAQMDASALPKGHIIGWAPPPSATANKATPGASLSKAAKKNEKRREKKREKKEEEVVKDNWDDDEEGAADAANTSTHTSDNPNWAAAPNPAQTKDTDADELANKLEKLDVRVHGVY